MKQLLDNPHLTPDSTLLRAVMHDRYDHFEALCRLFERLGITWAWNYYKDGKNWLCKAQHKNKTVLWLSVWEDCFRLSFFFNQKTRAGVATLDIAPALRTAFETQTATGKLIPLLLDIRSEAELADAETLIIYKIS